MFGGFRGAEFLVDMVRVLLPGFGFGAFLVLGRLFTGLLATADERCDEVQRFVFTFDKRIGGESGRISDGLRQILNGRFHLLHGARRKSFSWLPNVLVELLGDPVAIA